MATLRQIAERAGVSTATVSHVINATKRISEPTTARVRQAMSALGYAPRAREDASAVKAIGVVVEDVRCFPIPDILGGIAEELLPSGRQMLMYDLHLFEELYNQYELIGEHRDRVNRGVGLLAQARVEGIIYAAMHDRHLDGLLDAVPLPLVYAYSLGSQADRYVTYANKESAADVVKYLVSRGHRRIAVISGHPHSFPAMKRLSGFQIAMQQAGLSIPEGYLAYGDWEYASGYRRMKDMLHLPQRPTAVFALNDFMAAGCLHALLDSGLRVPQDVSLVGFDNREACRYLLPRLTTVDLPLKEIGRRAADMLLRIIREPGTKPAHEILPCTLIERDSVGPCAG